MRRLNINKIWLLAMIILAGSGCTSMNTLSSYARTGDTVSVSLGGTFRHSADTVLKKEEVVATITDSASLNYAVKVRHLFRLFSDPTSTYSLRSQVSGTLENNAGADQGQWMAIIDLVDPITNDVLPLQTGAATLSITAPNLTNTAGQYGNGDLTQIPIEILPGTGTPNLLNAEGDQEMASLLQPEPQVEVKPGDLSAVDSLGGVEYVFSYVTADFDVQNFPVVVKMSPNQNIQLITNYLPQGNGTTLIKVLLLNPNGFADNVSASINGKLPYRNLNIALAWYSLANASITDDNWNNSIQLVSSNYINLNGNSVAGIQPVLAKTR